MEQIKNIGLIGTFHLIGADASLVNQFVDEFLAYGEVELAEDFYLRVILMTLLLWHLIG